MHRLLEVKIQQQSLLSETANDLYHPQQSADLHYMRASSRSRAGRVDIDADPHLGPMTVRP